MNDWPPAKRIGFRFLFAYFVLYIFPFPLDYIPYAGDWLSAPWQAMWNALVPFAARTVFHVTADVLPNGSGDTTWNYVQVAVMLAMAAVIALIWSVLDRKRANYIRLHQYLHAYVRFFLAQSMFTYGFAKVIPSQFPPPGLDRLVGTYGASSPMGVLWTFMGTSAGYSIFTGAAELLGGILLIPRRTTLLGALVSIGVLSNVVALNFFYDVPVKLYSAHLLLMAMFVAAPGVPHLFGFFLRIPTEPLFTKRWAHIGALVFRSLIVGMFVYIGVTQSLRYVRQTGTVASRSPLRGVWNVDELVVDGTPRPPLVTDLTRWRRFVFDVPVYNSIYLMNDSRVRYMVKVDEKKKVLDYTNRDEPKDKFLLTYARPDPKTLQLDGTVDGRKIHAVCHLADAKDFLLVNRGFHWINERPFNR